MRFRVFAQTLALSSTVCVRSIAADPVAIAEWETATPESVGLDSAALGRLIDFAHAGHVPVHSVQIVRHAKLAFDVYFLPTATVSGTMRAGWDCGFDMSDPRANCHLLSAAVAGATGGSTLAFAREALFEPLGIRDVAWPADPQGINYGWSDLQLLPRDMAKLGLVFLQRGRWGDRQIVSASWIAEATRAHVAHTGNNDSYGYFW